MASLSKPGLAVLDVGSLPAGQGSLSLAIPGCTANTAAVCYLSGQAPPGKAADELEMDALCVWAETGTDTVT